MPTHHDETLLERYQREHRDYERIAMSEHTPEFRAQEIKTRRLEIAATLAEWKRAFFVDGIKRPFTDRVTLEAEYAALSLEARLIGDAAAKAKVERRKMEAAGLVSQLTAERDSLRAVNAELLEALEGLVSVYDAMNNPRGPKRIIADAAIAIAATGETK